MVKKEMYPQLKSMLLALKNMVSTFVKRATIIGLAGITAIIILYVVYVSNTCPIKQINVLNDMKKYDTTKNPELCNDINNRIIQLNNQCGIVMEILDCG
jgi:hypothetical protein